MRLFTFQQYLDEPQPTEEGEEGAAEAGTATSSSPQGAGGHAGGGGMHTSLSAPNLLVFGSTGGGNSPTGSVVGGKPAGGRGRAGSSLLKTAAGEEAALGTHIGLIALSVFLGYLLNLALKALELNREFLRNHHLISGIRLFKVGCSHGL